jgi:hypothetical protein
MTTDLDDRLRADLPRLADQLLAAPETDLPVLPVTPARRPARRWLVAAACAAVLVLVAGVALAARPDPQDQAPATTAVPTTTAPARGWSPLPPPPLGAREDAPSVWTGEEWLVFGGRDGIAAFADGAAYDPATDRWRALHPPIDMHPGAQAVWTGRLVVVLAKEGGWTFDPHGDEWADLPRQRGEETVFTQVAVWTGNEVVAVGFGGLMAEDLSARTFDPDRMTWGPGSTAPAGWSGITGARWDGRRVQVWLADGSGWAFDPATREWSPLPELVVPGLDPETTTSITGIGSTTYAMVATPQSGASSRQLAAFHDGRWTLVGDPVRTPPADVAGQLVAIGDRLAWFSPVTDPVFVDPTSGAEETMEDAPVPGGTGRSVAWTGSQLLVFGGRDAGPVGSSGQLSARAVALTP